MNTKNYRILGKVVDLKTRTGITGLRVEAWDKDLIFDDLLGSDVTDGQGAFEIAFSESQFLELFGEQRPDIFFKIFRNDELIMTTENSVLWNVEAAEIPIVIEGDFPMEQPKPATLLVRGQIRKADGSPLISAIVRAFDKDLRSEQLLGEQTTNAEGRYEITYTAAQLRRPEKKQADLIVRVFDQRGELMTTSPIAFKAKAVHLFDYTQPGKAIPPLSDFEKLASNLASVLEDTAHADLTTEDIDYLAGAVGVSKERVTRLHEAAKLARETDLPTEVFFALADQGLPISDLKQLLTKPLPRLREALEGALKQNRIPSALKDQLDHITGRLKKLIVLHALDGPAEPGKPSLGGLLGTSRLSREQQEALVGVLTEQDGKNQDFWSLLQQEGPFKNPDPAAAEESIDEVRFTLELGVITQNHLPLVQVLQKWRQESQQQGSTGGLKELAAFDTEDWLRLIKPDDGTSIGIPKDVPGDNDAERAKTYAEMLSQRFEAAFPSPALIARIARSDLATRHELTGFFAKHPDFDFATTRIESYFKKLDELAQSEIGDVKATKQSLKTLQRLFRLSPRFNHIKALMDAGFFSASSMAAVEPKTWVRRYADKLGGEDPARQIRKKASLRSASAQAIWSKYSRAVNNTPIAVIPNPPSDPSVDIPNWKELFGSPDLCACRHCRSVYGPAAYLVDCLRFLSEAYDKGSRMPLDVLFDEKRRPDIRHIELSCENTNTLLPYVDLVNEILEKAVVAQSNLKSSKQESYPQTTWTAEELAANPEHVNRNAYLVLSNQIFPWNLPFDHDATEARAYLKHLGTSRHELLEVFYNADTDPFAPLQDEQIAREYLGIPSEEWKLLTGEYEVKTWDLWGLEETGNEIVTPEHPKENPLILTWEEVLARCPEFLKRSGLTLDELIDLVELRFINPHKKIEIQYLETCKSENVRIDFAGDLDAPRRICFFVRLLRRLGWTMWELDQALEVFGRPKEWRQFLIIVSHIQRLREKLGRPVMEMLTWWGEIPTNPTTVKGQTKPSVYERIFLNKTVIDPKDKDTEDFQLTYAGEELQSYSTKGSLKIPGRLSHITAALGVTAAEVLLILHDPQARADVDTLKLSNLSYLYRIISFCRAARLSVREFIALRQISGIDPFTIAIKTSITPSTAIPHDVTLLPTSKLFYEPANNQLSFTGVLSAAEKKRLLQISSNPAYQMAINELFQAKPAIAGVLAAAFPFPGTTLMFLSKLEKLRATSFKISELDYLFRHRLESPEALGASLQQDAIVLEQLRVGLQKIAAENVISPDAQGELLRNKLTLLRWNNQLIERVIRTLNESEAYSVHLIALPAGVKLPAKIAITHDEKKFLLFFTGAMTLKERETLLALAPVDKAYQRAVENLFKAPRDFIAQWMRAFEWPTFWVKLPEFPANIAFFPELKDKIYHDAASGELRFVGAMEENEKRQLLTLSTEKAFQQAINDLFQQAAKFNPEPKNRFLTQKDADKFFNHRYTERPRFFTSRPQLGQTLRPLHNTVVEYQDPAVRFGYVLDKVCNYLRASQSESFVKVQLAQTLGLEAAVADPLLTSWLAIDVQGQPLHALAVFLDKALIASQTLVREKFAELEALRDTHLVPQFKILIRLRKIASILVKFRLGYKEAKQLFEQGKFVGWLDPHALPLEPVNDDAVTKDLYNAWEKLTDACLLRDRMGTAEPALFDLFELARVASVTPSLPQQQSSLDKFLSRIPDRMSWDGDDFWKLHEHFKFKLTDYQDEQAYLRLETCFRLSRRMGVTITKPANMLGWVKVPSMVFRSDAVSIKQTVKAKYDPESWLAIAKPLNDILREQKRQALVSFLTGLWGWDSDTLYEHFLIDVEMSPCMMTSRIKQAISSVQLFVQRCLLGLEKDVLISPGSARQWQEWRSRYRIWEANRKVFLYPENWIEPDLRDDKSPFFRELENELRQSEITDDSVETAYLHYLEKLDKVSHLEIVGQYYDEDAQLLHIFGRTKTLPHIYFYRNRDRNMVWTAWEKMNVDIEGNHLIPVVWNRRLYLFWPIFNKVVNSAKSPNSRDEEPEKHWEIQLASTEYKLSSSRFYLSSYRNGRWTPKIISSRTMTPHKDGTEIPVIEVGTPQEINNKFFYFRTHQLFTGYNTDIKKVAISCVYLRSDQRHALAALSAAMVRLYTMEGITNSVQYLSDALSVMRSGLRVSYDQQSFEKASDRYPELDDLLKDLTKFVFSVRDIKEDINSAWSQITSTLNCFSNPEDIQSLPLNLIGQLAAGKNNLFKVLDFYKNTRLSEPPDLLVRGFRTPPNAPTPPGPGSPTVPQPPTLFYNFYFRPTETTCVLAHSIWADTKKVVQTLFELVVDCLSLLNNIATKLLNAYDSVSSQSFLNSKTRGFIFHSAPEQVITEAEIGSIEIGFQSDNWSQENQQLKTIDSYTNLSLEFQILWPETSWHNYCLWKLLGDSVLLFSSQNAFVRDFPIFYRDPFREFQLVPYLGNSPAFSNSGVSNSRPKYFSYVVESNYHPYTNTFIAEVNQRGIAGLLSPAPGSKLYRQQAKRVLWESGLQVYSGCSHSIKSFPNEEITFENREAYGLYNLEIFFHAPLMIADRLSKNQRFAEAKKWFEYIFDPTNPWLPGNILRALRTNCVGEDVKRWQRFLMKTGFFDDQQDDGIFGIKTESATKNFQAARGLYPDGIVGPKTLGEAVLIGLIVEKSWQRPWKVGPFYENGDAKITIDELMKGLNGDAETQRAIESWQEDPFNPHLIARLRMVAYQKTVVMKYLDNLYAWADYLFRQDTIESINEAVQLYILAAKILGPRPLQLPEQKPKTLCYADIEKLKLDDFSNVLVAIENEIIDPPDFSSWARVSGNFVNIASYLLDPDRWSTLFSVFAPALAGVPVTAQTHYSQVDQAKVTEMAPPAWTNKEMPITSDVNDSPDFSIDTLQVRQTQDYYGRTNTPERVVVPPLPILYFCIPQNDHLIAYWDTLEDRLFKIRHCQNIEGQFRELALFEPAIEPGLLVRAKAAGVDFSTVLNDLNAPAPHYRFSVLAQKASELCQEVKALGAALLAALEKRDAEELALLRSGHEIQMLELVKEVRKQQIAEATNTLESLKKSKELSELKLNYYTDRISKGQIEEEIQHLSKLDDVKNEEGNAANSDSSARDWGWVPDISFGLSWGWTSSGSGAGSSISTTTGGLYGVRYFTNAAAEKRSIALSYSREAEKLTIQANYKRRVEEWTLQQQLAKQESKQIDKQIAAAEIREQIANLELTNHEQQMENARAVEYRMRSKFTNQDLYDWMIGQISGVYFQSYQLAYDTAKRAERCYRFELGLEDSDFISYGYWDSLRQGLLAAEQLSHDLKRMEITYLEKNKREYEITKHVSLALLDPVALVSLRQDGQCFVDLPEALFDLDCPGHFMRRIKSVSLTIPCVAGPYTSVNCTLTLLKNSVRKSNTASDDYQRDDENDDPRFADNLAALQSIVTSSAQNDSGLFELNFRDERYLPFEGAGAISSWRIELPREFRQFDYDTITDVILHVRYTAREGGAALREKALEVLRNTQGPGFQPAKNQPLLAQLVGKLDPDKPESLLLLSAKHDFPTEWYRFVGAKEAPSLEILLTKNLFLYQFHEKTISISRVGVALIFSKRNEVDFSSMMIDITLPPQDLNPAPKTFSLNLNQVTLETSSDQLFAGNTGEDQVQTGEDQVQVVGEIIVHEGPPQSNTEPTYSLKVSNIRESDDKAIDCANIDEILLVYRYSAKQ